MKRGLIIVVFLAGCSGWYYVQHTLLTTACQPKFVFTLSSHVRSFLSEQCCNRLQQFFDEHADSYASCKTCADELKKAFPCIKQVSFEHTKKATHALSITIDSPCCRINEASVLTSADQLVDRADWATTALEKLPQFTVADGQPVGQWASYLKQLPRSVSDAYAVHWVKRSHIYFRDKKNDSRTVFLAAANTPGDFIEHQKCLQLKETLEERKSSRKGQKKEWTIDLRFKNQIIVFEGGKS